MENSNQDVKASETSKNDHISETYTIESTKNPVKRKSEKSRKDEIHRVESFSQDLIAIGKSCCGRWIKFPKILGEGGYKTVFKGYDSEKGNNVAWCEFKARHVDTKEKQVNMMKEIEIMVKMDHPNIVACYDIFDEYIDLKNPLSPVNVKSIVLIEELLGEGTLKSVIKKNFINGELILEYSLILYWLHQIIDAMTYMHEKSNPPIIHRDLKADNCFLESKSSEKYLNLKIGDFGLAKQLDNKEKNTMLGTVGFMAPEVYDEKYDVKVDIYAFGMLILEVLTNRTPYDDCETVMQVAKHTMSGKLPELFSLISDSWTREVISCCIHPMPSYRPTAIELYFHPLFSQSYETEKDILPVEITPHSEVCTDRETIINNFVANMVTENGNYNTKFNLRMEFRNKRVQKSFNLDEGESLEFDLDVFKNEDIPELISNLKSEYQDNIILFLNLNKNLDTKTVNTQLEKFFKSMEIQMNFLVKMLLGKRWHFILNTFPKQNESEMKDNISGFSLLATYKKNWIKASNILETEIANYQKLNKSIENKKVSRVYKSIDYPKIDSISMNGLNLNEETDQRSQQRKMKEVNELNNYPLPMGSALVPNQPFIFPYNYLPSFGFPSDGSSSGLKMFNNPQYPLHYNQFGYDMRSDRVDNEVSHILKSSTSKSPVPKSKKSSNTEKVSQLKKNFKDGLVDKIFTFEEMISLISAKSSKKSRHPFMIIPVKGQSNAFRVVKLKDLDVYDNVNIEDSQDNKDIDSQSKNVKPYPKQRRDPRIFTQNPADQSSVNILPVDPNSVLNNPYDIQFPPIPYSFSNITPNPFSFQNPYVLMPNWIQQQNLFQQQMFQQQQQIFLQQQQLHYQQQLQQRAQQQQLQMKMCDQSQTLNSINNPISGSGCYFKDDTDKKPLNQSETKKVDNSVPKFQVKKIDESVNMLPPSTRSDSAISSLDEYRVVRKPDKNVIKEKKTKKNNCNLEILDFEKEVISEISINHQGEHSDNNSKIKESRDTNKQKSTSCQTFNDFNCFGNETADITKITTFTNDVLKFQIQKSNFIMKQIEDETLKDSSSMDLALSKIELAVNKFNAQQNLEMNRTSSLDFTNPLFEI